MKKIFLATGATLAALSLTGCASQSITASAPRVTQTPIASASPTPTDKVVNDGPHFVAVRKDGTKPFGSYYLIDRNSSDTVPAVYDYNKNVIVEVNDLGSVKPSEEASINGAKANHYEKYEIVLINNTTTPIDLSAALISNAQDGDHNAAEVFDGDLGDMASGTLLSGHTNKSYVAFGDDHGNVVSLSLRMDGGTTDGLVFSK